MQELNEPRLKSLLKILVEEDVNSPCEPALIDFSSHVVFTDGGIILEWPNGQIDDSGKLFGKLIEVGKKQEKMRPLRESGSWILFLTEGDDPKFHPVDEAEPNDDLSFMGCMDYICRTRRCHYRIGYIVAVEEMAGSNKLTYKCYFPPKNEDLVILCIFENDKLIGAIANEVSDAPKNSR